VRSDLFLIAAFAPNYCTSLVNSFFAMPHIIPEHAVERLATLNGVPSFEQWQHELKGASTRIEEMVRGSFEHAWLACFPTWLDFGRVADRSRGVHEPLYQPSFANRLGWAFAKAYRDEYMMLVDMLDMMPPDSTECLCAFDLLEMVAKEFHWADEDVPEEIYASQSPLPPAVQRETRDDERYAHVDTAGQMLRQYHRDSFGDEGPATLPFPGDV